MDTSSILEVHIEIRALTLYVVNARTSVCLSVCLSFLRTYSYSLLCCIFSTARKCPVLLVHKNLLSIHTEVNLSVSYHRPNGEHSKMLCSLLRTVWFWRLPVNTDRPLRMIAVQALHHSECCNGVLGINSNPCCRHFNYVSGLQFSALSVIVAYCEVCAQRLSPRQRAVAFLRAYCWFFNSEETKLFLLL